MLAEPVVELSATDDAGRRVASRLHHRTDLFIELPLLAGILLTGAWRSARTWPLTPLHWVKIAAGLVAVSANLVCVGFVVAASRRSSSAPAGSEAERAW